MNNLFKISLAMLIATALASFTILMYLVFASDPAHTKYFIAKQASLIIVPLSVISLIFTCFTCEKGSDSML